MHEAALPVPMLGRRCNTCKIGVTANMDPSKCCVVCQFVQTPNQHAYNGSHVVDPIQACCLNHQTRPNAAADTKACIPMVTCLPSLLALVTAGPSILQAQPAFRQARLQGHRPQQALVHHHCRACLLTPPPGGRRAYVTRPGR